MHIFLYGPPGAGKSTLGKELGAALDLPFLDLDAAIEAQAGMTIMQIFTEEAEAGFRQRELNALREVCQRPLSVVALGGGALLNPQAREVAEQNGQVLVLQASLETLLARLHTESDTRPLLAEDPAPRLRSLMMERADHYRSFPLQVETNTSSEEKLLQDTQRQLGMFRVRGMGSAYDVRIDQGGLDRLGKYLREREMKGPVAVVSDEHVAEHYLDRVMSSLRAEGYIANGYFLKPGEAYKTIESVLSVWNFFIESGIERGSTIIALGGGVVGDLTGFAAATFLRGVSWVNVPTTLLSMVDSSLGGKTGIDLPQAKNLVGAFYPPRLVLADPSVLETLPHREVRNGLSETIKHGVIADPDLFALCAQGWKVSIENLDAIVRMGMAVKLRVIELDPYEKGQRQALNLGHTIGHGVELASDFRLSHGEAVAVGMVSEARLAEELGMAERGLTERIQAVLAGVGLPVTVPEGISGERVVQAMQLDKKRAAGKVRFALPLRIGEVKTGVVIENWQELVLQELLVGREEK